MSLLLSEAIRRWAEADEDPQLGDLAGWVFADCIAADLDPEPYFRWTPPAAPPIQIPICRA